ncbi:MAG TPA: hypothetical protein ENN21_03925 [Spirochaetes bacterium]|nr:hypothetical protein [Spirochaetota bacterium]
MNLLKYGPGRRFVKTAVWLSWPIIKAAKKWSSLPVLKWIINPFFAHPWNEVTAIPINVEVPAPDSVPLPRRLLRRVVEQASDIFILDECICRGLLNCENHPKTIGCMALGKAVSRMHPSHGRTANREEAFAHIDRAAAAGLVANIAHVWIDPLAFGLTRFNRLMFICFCDDCCCLYRTHMRKRGPNLDRAYRRLPGISVTLKADLCDGCGLCAKSCFVAAVTVENGKAVIGDECRGCGRCVELCPRGALELVMEDEETLYRRIQERIGEVADIT